MGSAHPEIYCPVLKAALRNSVFAQIHISSLEETPRDEICLPPSLSGAISEADGFGPLKPKQWAILMYKHVDHHVRQFGV
jgi:hypothetical protein